jgi:hypothetical protein
MREIFEDYTLSLGHSSESFRVAPVRHLRFALALRQDVGMASTATTSVVITLSEKRSNE